jgi:hypothetical protein
MGTTCPFAFDLGCHYLNLMPIFAAISSVVLSALCGSSFGFDF